MAKKKPAFLNIVNNKLVPSVIDGTVNLVDETTIQLATSSLNGIMAASDKAKLDGITGGTPYAPLIVPAAVTLAVGDVVYVVDGEAAKTDRDADATAAADGIVSVAGATGENVTICTGGLLSGLSGLTPNTRYFVGSTAGAVEATAPTTGNVQEVMKAITTDTALVNIGELYNLA